MIYFILAFSTIFRVFCHNGFTPMLAMFFFTGFVFKRSWRSIVFPIAAMFLSDMILHASLIMILPVYSSLLICSLLGVVSTKRPAKLFSFGYIASPLSFYIITNFFSWVQMSDITNPTWYMYTHNLSGLVQCYIMGLPFAVKSFESNFVFLTVFVAAGFLYTKMLSQTQKSQNKNLFVQQ